MQRGAACGAAIKGLDKLQLNFTTLIGQNLSDLFVVIAQDERPRIIGRASDGLKIVKDRGVKMSALQTLLVHRHRNTLGRLAEGPRDRVLDFDRTEGTARQTR